QYAYLFDGVNNNYLASGNSTTDGTGSQVDGGLGEPGENDWQEMRSFTTTPFSVGGTAPSPFGGFRMVSADLESGGFAGAMALILRSDGDVLRSQNSDGGAVAKTLHSVTMWDISTPLTLDQMLFELTNGIAWSGEVSQHVVVR